MGRDRLKKLVKDERFIPGIYNYCDRWCERCPQTLHCLNFALSEEEFSDPETRDIRNEAFWKKLSEILLEAGEMLKEGAKKWGVDLETLDLTADTESIRARDEAAEDHVICRAARAYANMVEDWLKKAEGLPFGIAVAGAEGVDLEEAFEVIRWYQYFIAAKVMRAVRGKKEDEEEKENEFPSDSDGSAKIALIAMDRSMSAWAAILHSDLQSEGALAIISFLDRLRQAVEQTFPEARAFIRPGFDGTNLNV